MIQSEGHGLYLRGWQVAKGEGQGSEIHFKEKSQIEKKGMSEPKGKFPRPGARSQGGSFLGKGERGGSPQFELT